MSIFNGLAAAALIGLAGSLLPPPTFATVLMGSDQAVQQPHRGTLLAEATDGKTKATKAKTKAAKGKKPAAKAKTQEKGNVSTPLTPGEYR